MEAIAFTDKTLVSEPFTCATCVQTTLAIQEAGQEIIQLRRTNDTLFREIEELKEMNLVLSKRNRVLQRRITALQDQADAMFIALTEQDEQDGIST